MTNTYEDDAPHNVKLLEEIRCLRCVNERILRALDEGLFVDYQMEKFAKGPKNQPKELKRETDAVSFPQFTGTVTYPIGTGSAPSNDPCKDCQQMKQIQQQYPNGYVGDMPCQWCPHGKK